MGICFSLLAIVKSTVCTWVCKYLFENLLWFFYILRFYILRFFIFWVYILRKGISEYDRLNIWPGISLWYLGWSWTCGCKWSSCLSLLSSWAHRFATVPGSSSVLWRTSTMLFIWPSLLWCTAICVLDIISRGKKRFRRCVYSRKITPNLGETGKPLYRDEPVMISAADRWLLRRGCHSSERSGPGGQDHILSQLSFELPVSNMMPNSPVSFVLRSQHQSRSLHCSLLGKGTQCSREGSQQRVMRVGLEFSPWVNVWPWQGRCLLLISVSSFIKDRVVLLILSLWCYCWIWDSAWKNAF